MTDRPHILGSGLPDEALPGSFEDLRAAEGRVAIARWLAAPWALLQVLVYNTHPYPAGVKLEALLLAAVLPVGNVVILSFRGRVRTLRSARILAVSALAFDVLVASGFVWLFAFDQDSALWAILFLLPLEGAARFGLSGALGTWAGVTVLYIGREVWGSGHYGYPLQWESISFRMGIAFLISLMGGLTSRDLNRQRARLAAALAEIRRVDRLRTVLVSTLAHDVRSPLAAIRTGLSTLLRRRDRMEPEQVLEVLHRTDGQAERLERLAVGLLDLAQVERGDLPLSIQEIPLREAVERALAYADEGGRIQTSIDPSMTVRADPERLEQIVVNLASNALSYGGPPYEVRATPSGTRVAIDFLDRGDGVPEEERDGLFGPFGSRRDRSSVGLGLAIVKALVDAHGGMVSYRPNDGGGACFRVELPAGRDIVQTAESRQEERAGHPTGR